MRGRRSWRTVVAVVVGMLLTGVIGAVAAPIASAHSRVESSDPADGATVQTGPQQVSITFNEPLQESFAVLTVVGPDDHYWQDGTATVTGPRLSVPLRELGPAGTYTLNYRVTSADGHPVEGKRTFELATAGTGTPGPAVENTASGGGDGLPLWPFIVGAIVVLAGGLGVVLWLTRRTDKRSS
ncbi:Copper transport protein YcnJ [Gordonia insulae]|uniref:Copper transport protein YcnJ n=2 Tax=Gordonia insulae TaxID=2420509 RepID=A0A3G8JM37_9ACTN|nr:copper resistance CopC family protein [Gordonia insulae]AZG45665.1 Copper transport protein YcnJ [Gordonia insulae]